MEKEIEMEREAIIIKKGGGGAVDSVNGKTGDVVLTTSDLENTSDYQTGTEVESAISAAIGTLATVATTGDYDDLVDKPTIGDATLTIQKNGATVDSFNANATTDKTINITVPVTASDVNALPASTKYASSLTMTIDSSTYVVTATLKDQDGNTLGTAQTIDLPLESVVVNGSYDSTNKKIVLTLQNGNTVDIPLGDLISGLQTEITSANKLASDLVDDTDQTNKFVTASEKTFWNGKQDQLTAGANITIEEDSGTGELEISATDTTYSDFTGTDGTAAGTHGLVPAPATTDAGKFLGASGLWETIQAGGGAKELTSADYNWPADNPTSVALWLLEPGIYTRSTADGVAVRYGTGDSQTLANNENTVLVTGPTASGSKNYLVLASNNTIMKIAHSTSSGGEAESQLILNASNVAQSAGTSTTNVMSQNAVTSMVFADPATQYKIKIGAGASTSEGNNAIEIGHDSAATGVFAIAIGREASANNNNAVSLGNAAKATNAVNAVAIGANSDATIRGEVSFGGSRLDGVGYNNTQYRLLTNVYDPQSAHDAATKGYVDGKVLQNAGAPTTSTVGTVGQLLEDTTNGKLYICTAIVPGTDPDPDTYTWEEVGVGGGGGGMREITSADFNWPTANPDGVATWLLSDGVYYSKATKLYFNTSTNVTGNRSFIKSTTGNGSSLTASFYGGTLGNNVNVYLTNTNGSEAFTNTIASLADIYADPGARNRIQIGVSSTAGASYDVAVGSNADNYGANGIAIGRSAYVENGSPNAIALGAWSRASGRGVVSINLTGLGEGNGYNNSNYRLLTGLYDGQSAHDAATLAQGNTLATSAPTTATVGVLGQLYTDTTNMHTYQCTAIDDVTDPSNPSYTWTQRW